MKKVRLGLALAGLFVMSQTIHAQYADTVLSYDSGTGFVAGYTNTSSALGAPALGSSVNPMSPPFSKTQLISIGAGGEITLQMDSAIVDNSFNPYGVDFIIFANSFFVANGGSGQNETTTGSLFYHPATALIQVSADDVNWYTLNPALAPQPGEWFPSYGGGNPLIPVNPALASDNFAGMTLGQIESLYGGSAGGTGYDLAWAQDADGNSVDLTSADYVRIEVESGVLDMDAVSVVPEPSTFALALVGAAGLLCFRFKKPKLEPVGRRGIIFRRFKSTDGYSPSPRGKGRGENSSNDNSRIEPLNRFSRSASQTTWRPFSLAQRERAGVRENHSNQNPIQLHGEGELSPAEERGSHIPRVLNFWTSKLPIILLLALLAVSSIKAATFTENFTNDPSQNGWQVYGDTNLFQWDSTNNVVDVTWDSTQTNSYFYHPLGTALTRNDDFSIAFDLELNQAAAYGYGFELAIGLLNYSEATNTDFQRSTAVNSPDLVELDYFPDVGYGPTVWPLLVDSNCTFNYNDSSDYAIYAPNLGDWYHIVMMYSASSQTMVTTMTNFEQTSGITVVDPIMPFVPTNAVNFTDFHVDTFSISSYQDDGFGDSVYAQGAVSNIVLTLPPTAQHLACAFTNGAGQVQCVSDVNWNYVLERSADLASWNDVSTNSGSMGTVLTFNDTNAPSDKAFYRVRVSQP